VTLVSPQYLSAVVVNIYIYLSKVFSILEPVPLSTVHTCKYFAGFHLVFLIIFFKLIKYNILIYVNEHVSSKQHHRDPDY